MKLVKVENRIKIAQLSRMAKRIWKECYENILSAEQIEYMTEKYLSKSAISNTIANENYTYQFIIDDSTGTAVGFTAYKPEDDFLFLSKLYISEEYRGKGIGTNVIEKLKEECAGKKLSFIRLTVNVNNKNAINTYLKNGFYIEFSKCTDIGGGFVMDDHFMRCDINKT